MKDIVDKIKKIGSKPSYIIVAVLTLITAGINLYGYFKLPAEIATQFSLSGGKVNRMPTTLYLIIVTIAVLAISIFYTKVEKGQKTKWLLVDVVIVIANIAMIATQL